MHIKPIYINGLSAISIQEPLSTNGILSPTAYQQPHVRCIEPNFRDFFDPIASRRMSKVIKRAIVTARRSLEDAGIQMPDAIVTGTGLGCVEDTEKFLEAMIRNEEKFLQPAYFIQSTHNTISSQIAIHLGCNGYNNTYIHRGASFENGLMDVLLLFAKSEIGTALVTGNDEMTPAYFTFLKRLGYWKDEVSDSLALVKNGCGEGSFAGEGSVSVVLSDKISEHSYARIVGSDLFYRPQDTIVKRLQHFLAENNISADEIDWVLTGQNGDSANDAVYQPVIDYFGKEKSGFYKHICGEFFTASAFGLMVASVFLKQRSVPAHATLNGVEKKPVNKMLIYNHFKNKDHSFILLSSC